MAAAQIGAIGLCIIINMMDGFEIFVPSLIATQLSRLWLLTPPQLGALFSAGLTGMIAGALALSPLADWWGRRRSALLCLIIITIGMALSAAAEGLGQLIAARLLTGIGVGAMLAVNNTIVAEYANNRWRDLAVCLQATGVPLGGALGGLAAYLLADADWRWLFVFGAAFSALLISAVAAWLPESLDFLLERRPPRALERANRLLLRLNMATYDFLPPTTVLDATLNSFAPAGRRLGRDTLLICASCFLLMFTFYFLTNWMPKLLIDYGVSTKAGISGASIMNLGGVFGDLVFAALAIRWSAHRLGPIFMASCFVIVVFFAILPTRPEVLQFIAFFLGFVLFGSVTSIYATVPLIYPATRRASGTGLTLGIGRIGAAAGPFIGGLLISLAWPRTTYLLVMSAPLILCAAGILVIPKCSLRSRAIS